MRTYYFFSPQQELDQDQVGSPSGQPLAQPPQTPTSITPPPFSELQPPQPQALSTKVTPAPMTTADRKALRLGLLRVVKLMVEEAPVADEVRAMMLYVQVTTFFLPSVCRKLTLI